MLKEVLEKVVGAYGEDLAGVAGNLASSALEGISKGSYNKVVEKFDRNHHLERMLKEASGNALRFFKSAQRPQAELAVVVDLNKAIVRATTNTIASLGELVQAVTLNNKKEGTRALTNLLPALPPQVTDGTRDTMIGLFYDRLYLQFHQVAKLPRNEPGFKAFSRELLQTLYHDLSKHIEKTDDKLGKILEAIQAKADAPDFTLADEVTQEIQDFIHEEFKAFETKLFAPRISLTIPEWKEEIPKFAIQRLLYRNRFLPSLIGRENDLKFLRDFAEDERPVTWTLIVGEGGIGKTRLAYDFLVDELIPLGWAGGFLSHKALDEFEADKWSPEQPTLFIIDYARSKAQKLGEIVNQIAEHYPRFPVRFLLLDRYYKSFDRDWNQLVDKGYRSMAAPLDESSGAANFERAYPIPNGLAMYRPHVLEALSKDGFLECFCEAFSRLRGTAATEEERAQASVHFSGKEFLRRHYRPLYAGLAAEVAHEVGIERLAEISSSEILDSLVREEWKKWDLNVHQHDLNMVFVSTVAEKALTKQEFDGLKSGTATRGDFDQASTQHCEIIAGVSRVEGEEAHVYPLEPDLIGETFVKLRLRGEFQGRAADSEAILEGMIRGGNW